MPDVLFIGAGASKPFGIPTMIDFPDKIQSLLSGEHASILKEIRETTKGFGLVDDLETIFTAVSEYDLVSPGSISPGLLYRYSEHFHRILKEAVPEEKKRALVDLRAKIYDIVRGECNPQKGDLSDQIYQVYNPFFETISQAYGLSTTGLLTQEIFHVFTTNYDVCVEIYFDKARFENRIEDISLDDGVLADRRHWSPLEYRGGKNRLYKLHGSIDMQVTDRGIIKYLGDLPTSLGEEVMEQFLLFPVAGKYVYGDPFFEMFSQLKKSLIDATRAIVIGFSFRDDPIRTIFIDAVQARAERERRGAGIGLKIHVVDPCATTVCEKLKAIESYVYPIDGTFEDEQTLDRLVESTR